MQNQQQPVAPVFHRPWENISNDVPMVAQQPPTRKDDNSRMNMSPRTPPLPTLAKPSGSQLFPMHPISYEEEQLYPGLPYMQDQQNSAAHNSNQFGEIEKSSNEPDPEENFVPQPFVPCRHHAMLFTPQELRRIMNLAKLSHENKLPYMYIPEGVPPPMPMHSFGTPSQLFNNNLTTRGEELKLPSRSSPPNHKRPRSDDDAVTKG